MAGQIVITPIEKTKSRHNVALLGEETEQQLSLRVQEVEPGYGTPLHLHEEQAETFHVVRGVFRFQVGEDQIVGEAGFTVHIPKGTPHCFLYEDNGQKTYGQLISVLTPGVHDGFIRTIPEAQEQGMPIDELTKMAERFGARIIGPKISRSD